QLADMRDERERFPLGGGHGNRRVLEPLETVPHPDTPHRRRKHERPEPTAHKPQPEPTAHRPRTAPYVELHAHSAYSFLDGASQPEELAARAAELGYPALALTDHDGVYGSLEFAHAATAFGVRPITGAEVTLAGGAHVTLLVESKTGYSNLCKLLTAAHAGTRPVAKPPVRASGPGEGVRGNREVPPSPTRYLEPLPPRLDQTLLE